MTRPIMTITFTIVALLSFFIGCHPCIVKAPQTNFPGAEKHEITQAVADKYILNFQKNPQVPKIHAGAFQRAILDKILAQPGCDGVRIYYAQKDDSSSALILVGITSSGSDLKGGICADYILPCPPFCDPPH
jgi:hypothetical protein